MPSSDELDSPFGLFGIPFSSFAALFAWMYYFSTSSIYLSTKKKKNAKNLITLCKSHEFATQLHKQSALFDSSIVAPNIKVSTTLGRTLAWLAIIWTHTLFMCTSDAHVWLGIVLRELVSSEVTVGSLLQHYFMPSCSTLSSQNMKCCSPGFFFWQLLNMVGGQKCLSGTIFNVELENVSSARRLY